MVVYDKASVQVREKKKGIAISKICWIHGTFVPCHEISSKGNSTLKRTGNLPDFHNIIFLR